MQQQQLGNVITAHRSSPQQKQYRILDTLGQGGTGLTYAAQDLATGEKVALKMLSLRRSTDWKMIELFEREARILSQLNHPAIPRYIDYFQTDTADDRSFYLVQQLASGYSLATFIERKWQPDEAKVRYIAEQVLQILIYLHSVMPPVIHRDLKPQNIILDRKGKVSLVDFGAVQDTYHQTVTGGSTIVGTYGYMAPEQFRGQAVLATDLYGLGMTLLFLLTGQSPAELPQQRLKVNFRNHINVSQSFADWLDRLIEPAIDDRFASATEALAVLQGKQQNVKKIARNEQPNSNFIRVMRDDQQLVIEIPRIGLKSRANQHLALFNLCWNGLLLLLIAAVVELSLFLQPSNLLFFGLYMVLGLWLLVTVLYRTLSYTRLKISSDQLSIEKWLLGSRYQNAQLKTNGLQIRLAKTCLPLSQQRLFCVGKLVCRWRKYSFGEGLPLSEQEWIVRELQTFWQQNKTV